MSAKEEWALWCAIARRIEQVEACGAGIIKLASDLSNTHVDPPLNWSRKCDLEAVLSEIENHAKRALELVGNLKAQFCGTLTEIGV